LPASIVAAIQARKLVGIRAGLRSRHRFTWIWAVVVDGRVFARSWSLKPGGWYRTFLEDSTGAIVVAGRRVQIRAVRTRSTWLWLAIERAYALKYTTPGSKGYVRGFRSRQRRDTTIEFVPRPLRRDAGRRA
jgi:hypothetical protein